MMGETSAKLEPLKMRTGGAGRRTRRRRALWLRYVFVGAIFLSTSLVLTLSGLGLLWRFESVPAEGQILAKKSLPLSSTTMNAGKSTTSIFQTASMPSSGYSSISTFLMQSSASRAAGPPMEPR